MPRSIADSLAIVYSSGAGVVLEFNCRHCRARLSTMAMYVDAIYVFGWMWWYAVYRSVFLISIILDVHLIHMTAIMLSILRRYTL